MARNETVVLWLGLGVAAATLGVGWLAYQRAGQVTATPQGFEITVPATTQTMTPASSVIPGQTANAGTQGTSSQPNPGSSVIFNFTPPPGVTASGYPAPVPVAASAGAPSCGCAAPGAVSGSCTPGGGTVGAYGSPADVAAAIGANLGPAITAAFDAGQKIRYEQALNLYANNPTGANTGMIAIPPAASIGL